MFKKITGISAIVLGSASFIDSMLTYVMVNRESFSLPKPLQILKQTFGLFNHMDVGIFSKSFLFYLLPIIFAFLFILGGVFYVSSKGKNYQLAVFGWAMILLVKISFFSFYLIRLILDPIFQKRPEFDYLKEISALSNFKRPWFVVYFLLSILITYLAFRILKSHLPKKHLCIPAYHPSLSTNKGNRFIHSMLDGFMIMIICFPLAHNLASLYGRVSLFELRYMNEEHMAVLILVWQVCIIGFTLFYYIFMEGLFQRTPAKILTGTYVNATGAADTNFGSAALRTLCRYIPFNAISFLFDGNWHDRVSQTTVIDEDAQLGELESIPTNRPVIRKKSKSSYHRGFGEY